MDILKNPGQRQASQNFALRAYEKVKGHRSYALTGAAKNTLAILGTALLQKRKADGRDDMDGTPVAQKEMVDIIQKLNAAGFNLLQRRPGAPKALPTVWRDPVTQEPLPPPRDIKSKSLLAKVDPDLLAHFEAMEADAYGHVQKLREEEAQRQVIEAIVYGPDQHNPIVNPFLGSNETAIGSFTKNAPPELTTFFRYEAQPVALPLFGAERNMTIEGQLSKDPYVSALIELGRVIHRQWNAEDLETAKQQRAAADEQLRRLQGAA